MILQSKDNFNEAEPIERPNGSSAGAPALSVLSSFDKLMNLPPRISETYGQSDLFLFTAGGCHIFCRTLLELLPKENLELRHLHAKTDFIDKPGYHVYLYGSGFAVDALGIRREDDMIALFIGQRGWSFTPEPCSLDFLFEETREKDDVGPVNAWDLYLHPTFVDYVAAKAKIVISDCPGRYQVSLLLAGREREKNRTTRESTVAQVSGAREGTSEEFDAVLRPYERFLALFFGCKVRAALD